nr:cytosolic sulfotransferase 5-like [Coffea arabica]
MSTSPSSSSAPLSEDSELQELMEQQRKNLLSTLPRQRWQGSYLYKYNGFWFSTMQMPGLVEFRKHFQARDSDVLIITTPKSGTTWLKALAFALMNRNICPINQNHPLLNQNPHTLVLHLEYPNPYDKQHPDYSFQGSRRLLGTHCPLALLPESVMNSGCKIVYLSRNIKDIFVSYWHFTNKLGSTETSFEEFFDLFCKGVSLSGPIWDHVLGYWKASLDKPQKVLFLKYEEMTQEPAFNLKHLVEFLGCPISQEEETAGVVDEILGLCSFDHMRNLEVNKSGTMWNHSNQILTSKKKQSKKLDNLKPTPKKTARDSDHDKMMTKKNNTSKRNANKNGPGQENGRSDAPPSAGGAGRRPGKRTGDGPVTYSEKDLAVGKAATEGYSFVPL